MRRTSEVAEFLDIALRGRIDTVAELATLTGGSVDATEREVSRLEELGFLSLTDGVITYRRPADSIADVTRRILTGLSHDLETSIAETQGILRTLPKLLRAWEHGDTDVHGLPIDVMHGPFAAPDMYRLQAARSKPRTSYACMPDTAPLYKVLRDADYGSYWDDNSGPDHDIRLLVSTVDANTELGRNQIAHEINAGSQVRMHSNLPSFFWVLDHSSIGIPFTWGEAWPKPGRVGGYLEARRIHDVCAAHNVPVWCGGMLETGLGRAANIALAALPGFTLPGDVSASDRFYQADLTEPFVLEDGGLRIPEVPGLGVAPLADRLKEFTIRAEEVQR